VKYLTVSETEAIVLIDALNVRRSRWPNLPARELVDRCARWARRHGHRALVVFDGPAPRDANAAADSACEVIGTAVESADDWIARRASELAAAGRPYWLVTSDRELRRRAGHAARRQIGGGSFLKQLDAASE
jgi:predicted RNA-binding protein with PIN domain